MSEDLKLDYNLSRAEMYQAIIPQIKGLISGESDHIANISNIIAVLKEAFQFFWVGVYFVKGDTLVLGPFQGPVACTRIKKGQGVCGSSWDRKETIVVENVDEFPGHIACSSQSKSEIVLPAFKNSEVALVLDIDSNQLADFDHVDKMYLTEIVKLIEEVI
ncbi:GAF domain-containing protein [bacterium]|jgi:L-methionine (R)-S-oxide reductase|nr:GAF domain-containing protein [bacterium]